MANFVSELNSLDFSKYIGGPMQAAVDAQNSAAMAQVNFIQSVGLETGTDNVERVRMITFKYERSTGEDSTETVVLQVPFLTMLSIPALRIDEMTIDFNCKLNSVETKETSDEFSGEASLSLNVWKVKLNVSASYKHSTSTSENVERTYSMSVHVRVVNDEMPAGLEKLLNILETVIESSIEQPTGTGTTTTSGQGGTNGTEGGTNG